MTLLIWCLSKQDAGNGYSRTNEYMGQILQDGKKVLEMSSTYLHSKSRPAQTCLFVPCQTFMLVPM